MKSEDGISISYEHSYLEMSMSDIYTQLIVTHLNLSLAIHLNGCFVEIKI